MDADPRFIASATATAVAFFSVGVIKGKIVERALMRSGFETLLIRGMAATSHISWGRGFAMLTEHRDRTEDRDAKTFLCGNRAYFRSRISP
jgi:hypothetical protein